MILSVSTRTDIIAFYTQWFINRYNAGFFDVRNPFNLKLISRISFDNVDAIFFCTKNPHPIIPFLDKINKPILFHITLTGYKKDIEPFINKKQIIDDIKKISNIIGKDFVVVRYDPIFLSDKYNINYHVKAITKICEELDGYISKIIISFIDDYKNVRNNYNFLKKIPFRDVDYEIIGKTFSKIAHNHNITIHTCFEDNNLVKYGFDKEDCFSHELAYLLTGKKFPNWKARKGNKCNCVQMVDMGAYNTCGHMCKYCYANYDEKQVKKNIKNHNVNSSLLIGKIEKDDIIKDRVK